MLKKQAEKSGFLVDLVVLWGLQLAFSCSFSLDDLGVKCFKSCLV